MLVKFSSTATGSITMFGDAATQLIKMLGATGKIPGALSADDLPAAIIKLQSELQRSSSMERATDDAEEEGSDKEEREAPISLATRAAPLIDILQRAARNDAPVMWESV